MSALGNLDWCRQVREAGVVAVAQAFGLSAVHGGRSGLSPCPACDDTVRGHSTKDRRGPVGLTRDGMGWCCHRCGAKGDAVTLASMLAGAQGKVTPQVREACERVGLLLAPISARNSNTPRLRPAQPPPPKGLPPRYPPEVETRALMHQLFAIDCAPDRAAMDWLVSRGLDAQFLADAGLLMTLPRRASAPAWARCKGVPWSEGGHRLLAQLCDVQGRPRSFHARQVDGTTADMPKGTNPAAYDVRGLALACPLARGMLAGERTEPTRVLITEGLPDWLTWFQHFAKSGLETACIGIVAGSWTQEFADKLPRGSRVLLAGHQDAAGERYMRRIVDTLRLRYIAGEVSLHQRRPK